MADIYLPSAASTQFGSFPAGVNLNVPDTVAGFLALNYGAVSWVPGQLPPRVLSAQEYASFKGLVSGYGIPILVTLGSDASANATAIRAAIATGRPVRLTGAGNKQVARSIELPSNSVLSMDPDCFPQLPTNAHFALFKNRDAQNAIPATAIAIASNVATFVEAGHNRAVGDTVWIEGALGNTSLNGAMTITAATSSGWSIAVASNAALTNTNQVRIMVSVYNPIAGTNFVRASGIVTVTDSTPRNPGDRVYVTGTIAGTSSFKGMQTVLSVSLAGTSWTYANAGVDETATGTANVLGNTNIILEDFQYDGNKPNQSGLDQWLDFPTQFVNVGNMRVRTRTIRNYWWRGLGFWNAGEIDVPYCSFSNGNVGIQFDSGCYGIRIGKTHGRAMLDDVVAWGVCGQAGPFGETTCPSGAASMGSLSVDEIDGDSPTGIFKHYCQTGYDLGSVEIRRLRGTGRGVATDGNVGVSGGTMQRLTIHRFEAIQGTPGFTGVALGGVTAYDEVNILGGVDNYSGNANSFFFNSGGCTVKKLKFANLISETYTAGNYGTFAIGSGATIKDMVLENCRLSCGQGGTGNPVVSVQSGGRLNCLSLVACTAVGYGTNGTGTYAGRFVTEASGGRLDRIVANGLRLVDGQLDTLFYLAGGATTTTIDLYGVEQGYADDTTNGRCASVIQDGSSAKSIVLNIHGVTFRNIPNNFCQYAGSGTNSIRGSGINIPSGKIALLTTGTHTVRIDSPEARIDLGANAGSPPARLSPTAGDRVYNTNATGAGHYFRTAAGAWQLVA